MAETLSTNYQSIPDMEQAENTVSGEKFFVHLAGQANGAHHEFVDKLKGIGKIQVFSFGGSDFLVVFCPIVSRVGTDISVAMSSMPGGKPTILVAMHHTFDPEHVVAPSRRQVDNPNVLLTVDCLFHDGSLLKCNLNDRMWLEVEKFLGVSRPVVSLFNIFLPNRGLMVAVCPMLWWSWWRGWWGYLWWCGLRSLGGSG